MEATIIQDVFLDWDYDTFSTDGVDKFWLYDDDILENKPEFVYLEGYPAFGWRLERTLAKRIDGENPYYQLVKEISTAP
jgi:hypothetical protein